MNVWFDHQWRTRLETRGQPVYRRDDNVRLPLNDNHLAVRGANDQSVEQPGAAGPFDVFGEGQGALPNIRGRLEQTKPTVLPRL